MQLIVAFFCRVVFTNLPRCAELNFNAAYPRCDSTVLAHPVSHIGDGICDGGAANTEECGWDGGDCQVFNDAYPGCDVEHPSLIGDSFCDGGEYFSELCGWDGGDCGAPEATTNLMCNFTNLSNTTSSSPIEEMCQQDLIEAVGCDALSRAIDADFEWGGVHNCSTSSVSCEDWCDASHEWHEDACNIVGGTFCRVNTKNGITFEDANATIHVWSTLGGSFCLPPSCGGVGPDAIKELFVSAFVSDNNLPYSFLLNLELYCSNREDVCREQELMKFMPDSSGGVWALTSDTQP